MLGTILATAVTSAVTKEVVKGIGKAATGVAVGAAVGAVAAGAASHARNKRAAAQAQVMTDAELQQYRRNQAERAELERLRRERADAERAEIARLRRERDAALRQQRAAEADARIRQEQIDRERRREMEGTIKQLYAKFAICYYISMADGVLSAEEREELNKLCLDIYNAYPNPGVKEELLRIYNIPDMNFIKLERYLRGVDPAVIASFLTLADEMASADGNATEKEKESIFKLRKYLTDKTGYDYLGNQLYLDTDVNLQCPGCGSSMKLVPYDGKAVCPYCGRFKYLQSAKK